MLKGKVAYVTGSTRGIGAAIARVFAANGASVVVTGRSLPDAAPKLALALSAEFGTSCLGIVAEQQDDRAATEAYRRIFETYGRLDVLVNNAGVLNDALLGMVSEAAVRETFEINTVSMIRNIQSAIRLMRRAGGGSIVNLSSIIGTNGNAGQVVYGGSKAAVIGITKSAAKELAPANIRVNAIAPGFIDTDMARSLPAEKFRERLASIGMRRIGEPREVANVALFLASDMSSYVTGQVIGVDGAMLI